MAREELHQRTVDALNIPTPTMSEKKKAGKKGIGPCRNHVSAPTRPCLLCRARTATPSRRCRVDSVAMSGRVGSDERRGGRTAPPSSRPRVDGVAMTYLISAQARIRRAARRAGKARAKGRGAGRKKRRVPRKGRVGRVTRAKLKPKLREATARRRKAKVKGKRKSRRVKFKTTSIRPPFLGRGNSHAATRTRISHFCWAVKLLGRGDDTSRDAHADLALLLGREAHGI